MKLASLVVALFLCLVPSASAAVLEELGSFDRPIFVSSDPTDADRLLVVERGGDVVLVDSGGGRGVFADLSAWVTCCTGERGLLSIAPAADFATSGHFYASYAGNAATAGGGEGDLHVDSFRPDGAGGVVREPILSIPHPGNTHYGGQLQLGPDGYLYLSVGDGGGIGDPNGNGQDLGVLLGKLLRIDPRPGEDPAYEIPAGNPFAGGGGRPEIWGYGLRNPWRFSFDRGGSGMAIADVGQDSREEIDFELSPGPGLVGGGGANYGWGCREGLIAYPGAPVSCQSVSGFTDPVFDYPHDDPEDGSAHGCSIIGGYVVRDPNLGDLFGRYVYADLCEGEIRSLLLPTGGGQASGDRSEALSVPFPNSFGEDADGRIYVISGEQKIYRLAGEPTLTPPMESAPKEQVEVGPSAPLRLRLLRGRRNAQNKVALTARAAPCLADTRGAVRLMRGGRPFASRRLDGDCVARFRARAIRRTTFKALLELDAGGEPIGSKRLALGARR